MFSRSELEITVPVFPYKKNTWGASVRGAARCIFILMGLQAVHALAAALFLLFLRLFFRCVSGFFLAAESGKTNSGYAGQQDQGYQEFLHS